MAIMARTIPQRQLRNENAKVMDAVSAGETFIVTRNGEPVAELRPIRSDRKTFISRDDLARMSIPGVRIDPARFRRDLDDVIDQSV
jgi:prevent-host-death family protein